MPDIQIRPEVVALLTDVDLSAERWRDRTMTHDDGRPVTDAEYELIGTANVAEMKACRDFMAARAEITLERARDTDRAMQIMEPYFARLGENATVGDVRKICTQAELGELDAIFERTNPDGWVYLTADPLAVNDPGAVAERMANAERKAWEAEHLGPDGDYVDLGDGHVVKKTEYDPEKHGPKAE